MSKKSFLTAGLEWSSNCLLIIFKYAKYVVRITNSCVLFNSLYVCKVNQSTNNLICCSELFSDLIWCSLFQTTYMYYRPMFIIIKLQYAYSMPVSMYTQTYLNKRIGIYNFLTCNAGLQCKKNQKEYQYQI